MQMFDKTNDTNKSCGFGTNRSVTNAHQRGIVVDNNNKSYIQSNMASDVSTQQKKRPLSISSMSSSSSSSCSSLTRNGSLGLGDTKKSYLASIESLDDAADDTDDDSLGIIRMIRAKVSGCGAIGANSFQDVSASQQSLHSSQPQSDDTNSVLHPDQSSQPQPQHCRTGASVPKYMDINLSHIERVIIEIVETERQYVRDLHEIIEGYLLHMKAIDDSKINSEEIVNLFSNIEDIHSFNSTFFSQLEDCGLSAVSIAKCFIQNSNGFDIYTHYCTNYPRTVSLLTEMMRNTERAEVFRERQLSLKHSLPLGSYLLKPVQRILKYHLLLQNIVKYTDKETNECLDIKNALSVMTNIAIHINDMKRKHEHEVRVQEIQSLLYNWEGSDLTTYGDLQCEGSFRMFGAKGFRHLFLFDRMLLICKKRDDGALNYKTHILCSNLMLIESIQGQPLCFHAIPFDQPRAQYTFQARNLEQKREWCLLLKRVILENYDVVIPSHAKQIVMQLGQTANAQSDKAHINSKRTLSAPEYLERRKQENRRKSESTLNHNLSKGFKLRKSLKKMHYMDNNGCRRSRSSSHDENARTGSDHKDDDQTERRSSLGPITLNDRSGNGSNTSGTPSQTKSNEQNEGSDQTIAENKSDNDLLNKINDSKNILDMRPPPRTLRLGHQEVNDGTNGSIDSDSDYVTFYITSNSNRLDSSEDSSLQMSNSSSTLYNRTSTPLSSGSSELSMASSSQSEDSKYVVLPVNALLNYTNHITGLSSPLVRRVQSFTSNPRTKAILQHSLSLRHSLTPDLPPTTPNLRSNQRPNTLNLSNSSSSSQLPTSNSMDEMSPTAPAIWLKRQENHFANSCKKSGSLPRSFETCFESTNESTNQMTAKHMSRTGGHGDQRPLTIAADQPYIEPDIERYIEIDGNNQCLKSSASNDDMKCSDDSPAMSLENVSDHSVLHPEHKIYRHSASKYIKSMIYNVSSKFVSLRRSPTSADTGADNSSIISGESGDRCESPALQSSNRSNKPNEWSKYEMSPKLITTRFVHTLAKAYSNLIKNKLKNSSKIETDVSATKALSERLGEIPSPVFARISVPTTDSVAAAARMASYNDYDDCYGVVPKHRCGLNKHNSFKRPDSLVSDSSNISMTSENDKNDCNESHGNDVNDNSPSDTSDSSLDSFYEQTFEAIESVLAEEMFGESGFYSDHMEHMDHDSSLSTIHPIDQYIDDNEDNDRNCDSEDNSFLNLNKKQNIYKSIEHLKCVNLNLNIMSAKRVKGAIIEKLKVLEENSRFHKDLNVCNFDGIKSIKERVEELENWCNNKEIFDEMNDSLSEEAMKNGSPKPNSKGWVKHVIEKLQNDENQS